MKEVYVSPVIKIGSGVGPTAAVVVAVVAVGIYGAIVTTGAAIVVAAVGVGGVFVAGVVVKK